MEQRILENVPFDERIATLESSAEKIEFFSFSRELTEAEMEEKRKNVTDNLIQITKAKQTLEMAQENYKAVAKPLEKEVAKELKEVSSGVQDVNEKVYLLKDLESQRMGYYSKEGKLVFSRQLKPEENQYSMADYAGMKKAE